MSSNPSWFSLMVLKRQSVVLLLMLTPLYVQQPWILDDLPAKQKILVANKGGNPRELDWQVGFR